MSFMKRLAEQSASDSRRFVKTSNDGPFQLSIGGDGKTDRYLRSTFQSQAMEKFNKDVRSWAHGTKTMLKANIGASGINGMFLRANLNVKFKKEYGEIFRIGFKFPKQGIYVHKGVGRGYKMNGDRVVKTAKNSKKNRVAKPWFNPVIEQNMKELTDIIQDYTSETIINTSRIFIK